MGVSTAAPARKRRRGNGAPLIKISVSPSNNINIRWTTVLPPNSARERDTRFWKTSPRGAQFVRGHLRNNLFEQSTIRVLSSKMQSNLQRVLRRTPLAYGTLLAGLPLMLGAMIGPLGRLRSLWTKRSIIDSTCCYCRRHIGHLISIRRCLALLDQLPKSSGPHGDYRFALAGRKRLYLPLLAVCTVFSLNGLSFP